MALRPCSTCGEKVPGKLASLYWAWTDAQHERVAFKQWLCYTCLVNDVLPLAQQDDANWLNCPVCHTDESEDMDPVFLKLYIPGQPEQSFEWATGAACAVQVRLKVYDHAERLADRQQDQVRGQAPNPPDAGAWASLGLRLP